MALKFLKKSELPFNLTSYLKESTERLDAPRPLHRLHASELTRQETEFCPRERVIKLHLGVTGKDKYIGAALALTFDIGEEYSTLVREKYLKKIIVGDWACVNCNSVTPFSKYPSTSCSCCGCSIYRYEEVRFRHPSGADGGIDAIIAPSNLPKMRIVEIKSISKDDFKSLIMPQAEHRVRTVLYLSLIEHSDHPYKHLIDTSTASIVYVSKGFGVKGIDGFIPYKEFEITSNDANVTLYHDKAQKVTDYLAKGVIPSGVCMSIADPRCKKCSVSKECWSGFDVGTTVTPIKIVE